MNGNGSAEGVELVGEENYSLSNNSHDPYCFVNIDVTGIPAEVCQCCASIVKARTDEREQAALRVAGISSWPDAESNDPFDRLCRWHGAVAAARGETCQADGIDAPPARVSHASDNLLCPWCREAQ